uniref:Si:ch211-120g10.1 n=1 Tax=Neogobius melanostomus TaxID=47308 RepID=A0A8C6WPT7_9GOBI
MFCILINLITFQSSSEAPVTIVLIHQETHKKNKKEKEEPLDEDQLFIVELAKDINRVCQRSEVLEHIWNLDDTWSTLLCRFTILEWGNILERKQSVWPGEPVVKVLEDLKSAWRWGRVPCLVSALELVMWTLLDILHLNLLFINSNNHSLLAVDITLDLDTANPDLLITGDKRMRCGFERKDVPNYHQRFDGWWCVEVGERDWRLGVAKESSLRKGFKSLNTNTGYLTLRLERGSELKALTVPYTALPPGLISRKVGVYLDYENGQLSFYDVDKRFHIYTYNERFTERLFPLFGTVEILKDLVIRSPVVKNTNFLCPTPCLWA